MSVTIIQYLDKTVPTSWKQKCGNENCLYKSKLAGIDNTTICPCSCGDHYFVRIQKMYVSLSPTMNWCHDQEIRLFTYSQIYFYFLSWCYFWLLACCLGLITEYILLVSGTPVCELVSMGPCRLHLGYLQGNRSNQ